MTSSAAGRFGVRRRCFRARYLLVRKVGPLDLRVFSDYPMFGSKSVRGSGAWGRGAAHSAFVVRSSLVWRPDASDEGRLRSLRRQVDPARVIPGSRWGRRRPIAAAVPALARAIEGGNYCVGSDAQHALVIDYHRRTAIEVVGDPGLAALRRRDMRFTVGPLARFVLPGMGAGQIHAAGMLLPSGRGVLALGPSGAGKTTLARLAAGRCRVVSDDRIVVWRRGASYFMARSADECAGMGPGARGALAAVLWLRHGRRQALQPVRWVRLAPAVWRDNRGQWAVLPAVLRARLYELYCGLLSSVPCYELAFRRDRLDWDTIERTLSASVPS